MRARVKLVIAAMLFTASPLLAAAPPSAQASAPATAFDARIAESKAAMMTNPQAALDRATRAEQLAAALPSGKLSDVEQATAQWLKGEALARLNRPADAFPVTSGALRLAERAAPRTKLVADLYRSQGNLLATQGQVEAAFRSLQLAHDAYRRIGEHRGEAMSLQNIGSLYSDAGDYERVLYYYAQSADVYPGDPQLTMSALNNQAEALKKLGRYKQAWPQYRAALAIAHEQGSASLEARILTNLADAQVSSGDLAAASATADRGLALATGEGAQWRSFLYAVKAKIELKRGHAPAAADWVARTFDGVDLAGTSVAYREAHEIAYQVYSRLGDAPRALAHLEAFKRLDDESRALTASSAAALVAANFDFANQNLRIAQLKAGQTVRDAKIEQANARMNSIVLGSALGVGGVVLVMLSIGFFSLRRSRDEVRAANESLSNTNVALQSALAAKTQFLATTSHEIRTPLNGILGMTEVILSQRDLSPPLRERLAVVHGAGKTMRALVDDILDVAKMENGNIALARDDIDLPELLGDVGRLWETQARAKGVEIRLDLSACPASMIGDEARLRQIVFNLMSNAVKFTQAGCVCLKARLGEGVDPRLAVTVHDSGIGIPADKLGQIFEAFSQVDTGTTRQFGGTGLGLAIVRNLARAMGGDIAVTSELGEGSLFELTLPYQARASAAVAAGEPAVSMPAARTLATARLLVIERNPLTQSVLEAVLEPHLRGVEFANDGDEAAAVLRRESYDHVVIDLASLGSDPVAGIAALRENAPGASLTVLAGELPAETFADLARMGVARVLTKPVAAPLLLATLRQFHDAQQILHTQAIGDTRDAA